MSKNITSILHIIHGLTIGGAEMDLLNKSITLATEYRYDITICCLLKRGDLAHKAENAGITVIGPIMKHRYDILGLYRLRHILTNQKWQIIHSHLFAANFIVALLINTIPHLPLSLLAAEHAMAHRWSRFALWLDRFIQNHVDIILMPSTATKNSYVAKGLNPQKIKVIHNAIDISRFNINKRVSRTYIRQELGLAPQDYLIGTICRLTQIKNLPILIDAIADISVHLVIVGDGPEKDTLDAICKKKSLKNRVHLIGSRTDIPEILSAIDLFVLPSQSETFGLVIAEALLMKIPVIATNVGGIPELTKNGLYAQLIPPNNLNKLKDAILYAIDNPLIVYEQAEQGYHFIYKSLSTNTITKQQHKIYQTLITQNNSRYASL